MPLFEYKCDDCLKYFEELISSGDEKVVCPECNSSAVLKQLSTFSAAVSSSTTPPCGNNDSGCGSGYG
jgi:putative FmdB family regulatory protein